MNKSARPDHQLGLYSPGLDEKSEAVISAHFMHQINQDLNLKTYSAVDFSQKALLMDIEAIRDHLIPTILEASHHFILKRISAAKTRAGKNFKKYGLAKITQISTAEIITEVLFDRQFLKGPKSNCSRLILSKKIRSLIEKNQPIKMTIPALPYKSSSPLKTRGVMPDLSEINFLLSLAEIAHTIDLIYQETNILSQESLAKFTVVSDGSRFNSFLNEPIKSIKTYQDRLKEWIDQLNISNYVEIIDYQWLMDNFLPKDLYRNKIELREQARSQYSKLMLPLFNPDHIEQTINKAIELDPEPESSNPEGRFIPLFKSLIYIIRYKTLWNYTQLHGKQYDDLYIELTRHIFEPYTHLIDSDLQQIALFIKKPQYHSKPDPSTILEYLRQSMLWEAWNATINYISEIKSDRDLPSEPIATCLPNYIRWTIHAKMGQLAILTTTVSGDPVQAWHGVGVFKLTKNHKIKIYTLPTLLLEGNNATPVIINNGKNNRRFKQQPLFYVYPDIKFKDSGDLLDKIKKNITRSRKM